MGTLTIQLREAIGDALHPVRSYDLPEVRLAADCVHHLRASTVTRPEHASLENDLGSTRPIPIQANCCCCGLAATATVNGFMSLVMCATLTSSASVDGPVI
jgi:hypothetical protein